MEPSFAASDQNCKWENIRERGCKCKNAGLVSRRSKIIVLVTLQPCLMCRPLDQIAPSLATRELVNDTD